MVSELFKLEPLYWTMATFGGVGRNAARRSLPIALCQVYG